MFFEPKLFDNQLDVKLAIESYTDENKREYKQQNNCDALSVTNSSEVLKSNSTYYKQSFNCFDR